MGANISVEACKADFGITVNCSASPGQQWGEFRKGEFPPDADIAGIGIVAVFIAVTALALIIGYIDVLWQLYKSVVKKGGAVWQFHEDKPLEERTNPSVSDILETIVISCSDQQLFTGGAYALTVRYFKGCSVSAYHYNILVNGLLITCATHLVAVTVVMNYWRYPLMAMLRVAITVLIFLVTGLLLAKRTGTAFGDFPLAVPPTSDFDAGSPLFLRAACFETDIGGTGLTRAVQGSLDNLNSVLHGPNQAWTLYIAMLLWWGLAVVAEMFRFLRRGAVKEVGRRKVLVHRVRSWATGMQPDGQQKRKKLARAFKVLFHLAFMFYLVAGLGISTVVVVITALYIQSLREWVNKSGWLDTNGAGSNPENEVTTFGQLVPILMAALTVFAFMQMLSEKIADARRKRHRLQDAQSRKDDEASPTPYTDEKKDNGVTYFETPVPGPSGPASDEPGPGANYRRTVSWGTSTATPTPGAPTPASTFIVGSGETPLLAGGSTPGLGSTPGFVMAIPLGPEQGLADEIKPAPPVKGAEAQQAPATRPALQRTGAQGVPAGGLTPNKTGDSMGSK